MNALRKTMTVTKIQAETDGYNLNGKTHIIKYEVTLQSFNMEELIIYVLHKDYLPEIGDEYTIMVSRLS